MVQRTITTGFLVTILCAIACRGASARDLMHGAPQRSVETVTRDAGTGETALLPAPAFRTTRLSLAFALYYLPKPRVGALTALKALPAARAFEISSGARPQTAARPTITVLSPTVEQAPPPSRESLKYSAKGLDEAQKEALLATSELTAFLFDGSDSVKGGGYAAALRILGALASRTGGLPFDPATRQVFSLAEWQKRIDGFEAGVPDVAAHLRIDAYREGELLRLVTLGMEKFGLPDIAVNEVSSHEADAMASLVTLLCQTLVENGGMENPGKVTLTVDNLRSGAARGRFRFLEGAKRQLVVEMAAGHPHEGDAENRLVDVVFPGADGQLQERQSAALVELFGAKESLAHAHHDADLLAASARARAKLLALKPVWSRAIPELQRLMVKAPFQTPSGANEWMWVEVTSWQQSTIRGVLANDPFEVKGLKAGARVAVEESSIFDYILTKADGTHEGNETGKLIEQQQ